MSQSNDVKANEIEYSYDEIRKHRTYQDAWCSIHGVVYDITKFVPTHPGGAVIHTAFGRDATILYETHHNLLPNLDKVTSLLKKYRIGKVKNYVQVAKFDSPFALTMLSRCREALQGYEHRDSFYAYTSVITFYAIFLTLIGLGFYTGSYFIAAMLGAIMAVGHLVGHAGNHWSLSKYDIINRFLSITCTNLWGLREKNWEFSHLISHHCYNYSDRDYIMEQHVPLKYFRVRETDAWKPIHAYQHIYYLLTPITAFFVGSLRLDCTPWIFISPLLTSLRMNSESPLPAPQFFASGSNADISALKTNEDGVGPTRFVVYDDLSDMITSIVLANLIWLPLFIYNWYHHSMVHAILFNSIAFGVQAALVTKSLLTQHLCEDIKLQANYESNDDWYAMQVEASTTIQKPKIAMWLTHAISFQTEHHMFPCLNPESLLIIQPIVKKTSEEFGVQYNYFNSEKDALISVFRQFKNLSTKPVSK